MHKAPKIRPLQRNCQLEAEESWAESIKENYRSWYSRVYERVSQDRLVHLKMTLSTDSVRKTTETDPIYAEIQDKGFMC